MVHRGHGSDFEQLLQSGLSAHRGVLSVIRMLRQLTPFTESLVRRRQLS